MLLDFPPELFSFLLEIHAPYKHKQHPRIGFCKQNHNAFEHYLQGVNCNMNDSHAEVLPVLQKEDPYHGH